MSRSLRVVAVLQEPIGSAMYILGSSDTNYEKDFAADQLAESPRRRGKSDHLSLISTEARLNGKDARIRQALKLNLARGRRLRRPRRRRRGESARPLAQSQEHTPAARMRPDCQSI